MEHGQVLIDYALQIAIELGSVDDVGNHQEAICGSVVSGHHVPVARHHHKVFLLTQSYTCTYVQ